jgi:hypothetical protein
MWKCALCGESIADDVDVCRKCGGPRDEVEKASLPHHRPLTEASFAKVMLRLVGLYIAALGFIGVASFFIQLGIRASRLGGLDKAMEHFSFEFVVRPVLELLVGVYLLIGGHWAFRKILSPIRRPPADDDFDKST